MIADYFFCLWLLVEGSLALRIIGIGVPTEVLAGRDVLLQCHYDLEGSPLYALKWYKGSHEFYRFILKEVPPVQIFPWSSIGIHHEETRSRIFAAPLAGRVLLRNVTAAAEGVYKCEISTEAPYFDTEYEEANLSVVEVSHQNPVISLMQPAGRRSLGDDEEDDVFHFKCCMNGTRPASRLSWLVNHQPIPNAMVLQSDPVLINGRLYRTESQLRLEPRVWRTHPHQSLQVTCLSHVGRHADVLQGRSEWIIQPTSRTEPSSWPSDPGGGSKQLIHGGAAVDQAANDESRMKNASLVPGSPSDDATAQSISDSESPSRRTQPVVGSYPGRGNNKSSPSSLDSAANKSAGRWTSILAGSATGTWLVVGRLILMSSWPI